MRYYNHNRVKFKWIAVKIPISTNLLRTKIKKTTSNGRFYIDGHTVYFEHESDAVWFSLLGDAIWNN